MPAGQHPKLRHQASCGHMPSQACHKASTSHHQVMWHCHTASILPRGCDCCLHTHTYHTQRMGGTDHHGCHDHGRATLACNPCMHAPHAWQTASRGCCPHFDVGLIILPMQLWHCTSQTQLSSDAQCERAIDLPCQEEHLPTHRCAGSSSSAGAETCSGCTAWLEGMSAGAAILKVPALQ